MSRFRYVGDPRDGVVEDQADDPEGSATLLRAPDGTTFDLGYYKTARRAQGSPVSISETAVWVAVQTPNVPV